MDEDLGNAGGPAAGRATLRRRQQVVVFLGRTEVGRGVVDEMSPDGSVVWVVFDGAPTRRMFLQDDPEDILPVL
jgi:hypothetical protein